jgi:MFS family permease
MGTNVQFLALPLLVLALTGSPGQAGVVLGLHTLAVIALSLVAGVLVDRWNRKSTMIWCDAGRMLLTVSIPVGMWLGHLPMVQIYLVVTMLGALGTCFTVANTTALPNIVQREQLADGLRQSQTAYTVVRLCGSVIGGFLFSLGRSVPFVVNAVSFAVSVVSLRFIRARFQQEREVTRRTVRADLTEGLGWLWNQSLLRFLTLVNGADSLRYGAGYLVIIMLARQLHTSSVGIGAIFTAAGVGALLGNAAGGWARRRFSFGRITVIMLWVEAVTFPVYAVAPSPVLIALIALVEEFVAPIYNLALSTYWLSATPDALRGRVASTIQLVTQGAQSLGAIISGFLIELLGANITALCLGGWLLVLASVTTLNGQVRQARRLVC